MGMQLEDPIQRLQGTKGGTLILRDLRGDLGFRV